MTLSLLAVTPTGRLSSPPFPPHPCSAAYHDVHHDFRHIKKNYSQPFFTHWDWVMGEETDYGGEDKSGGWARRKAGSFPVSFRSWVTDLNW